MNYAKMKVQDLKQSLIDNGYDPVKVEELKKPALIEVHQKLVNNDILDSLQHAQPDIIEEEVFPTYDSIEWAKHVMDQFTSTELDDSGNPKIAGLRRVAYKLLGPIISSGPIELFPSVDPDGPGRASAIVEIVIVWNDGSTRSFRGAGSSWMGNTDDEFAVYPEAMAETRAEARALRKALGLYQVSADETTKKDTSEVISHYKSKQDTDGAWGTDVTEPSTDNQIKSMQLMCDRLQIDVTKFINSGKDTYDNVKDIKKITAAQMLKRLNQYQTDQLTIPEELKVEANNEN